MKPADRLRLVAIRQRHHVGNVDGSGAKTFADHAFEDVGRLLEIVDPLEEELQEANRRVEALLAEHEYAESERGSACRALEVQLKCAAALRSELAAVKLRLEEEQERADEASARLAEERRRANVLEKRLEGASDAATVLRTKHVRTRLIEHPSEGTPAAAVMERPGQAEEAVEKWRGEQ